MAFRKTGTGRSTVAGQSRFSQIPEVRIQRSRFNRSHGHKTTFNGGKLVPVFVDEVLPGDTFRLRSSFFARLSTPIYPLMDNLFLDFFFFFVPNRLLWENWQKFNGEQANPGDSTDYLIPTVTAPVGGYTEQSLEDYMGLPTKFADVEHSALWMRAYNLIYNEWFRDQNLQNSAPVPVDDGPDDPADYVLLNRGKRHDYFTSCLPWPQKGTAVSLPLTGNAPVTGAIVDGGGGGPTWTWVSDTPTPQGIKAGGVATDPNVLVDGDPGTAGPLTPATWADPDLALSGAVADLSAVTAATINDLRQAFQIQRLYERDARGGTRYTEIVRSHFGVISPDARLQRPEYLGGGSLPVNIMPVAQTSETATTPQAGLSGFGVAAGSGNGFLKSFTEHGVLIGLVNARADLTYQQGLERMWSRSTRWDFYWPSLAHLGEQAVLNKELFWSNDGQNDDVFGYQERYAEYRYKPSRVSGRFRSNCVAPLDAWHLALDFSSRPALNGLFIVDDPPIDRVVAVPSEPEFLLDSFFSLECARPMPVYSVPGLIDHF